MADLRPSLRRAVAGAAVPYGYTILNTAAAGVLIDTHGPPSSGAALLFLCGAILGFALAAGVGRDGAAAVPLDATRLGLASGGGALGAFACAAAVAHAVDGRAAFGLVGLLVTTVYLFGGALAASLLQPQTP